MLLTSAPAPALFAMPACIAAMSVEPAGAAAAGTAAVFGAGIVPKTILSNVFFSALLSKFTIIAADRRS